MLDQLVRDYTDNIGEAEQAIAQTIGNVRMMEDDYAEDQRAAEEWGRKAVAASQKADEFRSEGNAVDASKFDNLARIAIGKQMDAENEAKAALPNLQAQQEVAEKLKIGLAQMRDKLDQLTAKRTNWSRERRPQRHRLRSRTPSRASTSWTPPARSAASRTRSSARRQGCAGRPSWPRRRWTRSSRASTI